MHFRTADNPQFVVVRTYPAIFRTRNISLKVIYIKTGAVIWPQRDRGQYSETRAAVNLPSGWSQLLQPQNLSTPTWTPLLTVPSTILTALATYINSKTHRICSYNVRTLFVLLSNQRAITSLNLQCLIFVLGLSVFSVKLKSKVVPVPSMKGAGEWRYRSTHS